LVPLKKQEDVRGEETSNERRSLYDKQIKFCRERTHPDWRKDDLRLIKSTQRKKTLCEEKKNTG